MRPISLSLGFKLALVYDLIMDPSQGLKMTNGEEVPLWRDLGYLAREFIRRAILRLPSLGSLEAISWITGDCHVEKLRFSPRKDSEN